MQSLSTNLLAAVHSANRQPFASVTVDDQRIRGWRRSDNIDANAYPFDARLTNNSKLIRARNVTGSPGTLTVALATIGAAPTFANTLSAAAPRQYSGVSLFNDPTDLTNPDRIDCHYIDNTAGTPKLNYYTSATDNGATWAGPNTWANMSEAQQTIFPPQLAAAGWDGNSPTLGALATPTFKPYLFYTSASSADTTYGVTLFFYNGRSNTHFRCTLDTLDTPYEKITDYTLPITGLGAFQLNLTDFACVMALQNVRNTNINGLFLIWYRDGLWSTPYPIFPYQDTLDGTTNYSLSSPTIRLINGVYWVTALESYATKTISITQTHLVAFRSTDAIHWSDRIVLAGNEGIGNGYWTSVPAAPTTAYQASFTSNDFAGALVLASGARTFLVGSGRLWQLNGGTTSAISSTASDYSANQLDLTNDVTDFTITQPSGPAAQGALTLQNATQQYNNSNILRRGARVIIKAGYKTLSNDATDLATLLTGSIDEVRQEAELGRNEIKLTVRDLAVKRLETWTADNVFEYSSARNIYLKRIADYGSTIQAQGSWLLQRSQLVGQAPPVDSAGASLLTPNYDILIANTGRIQDGIWDCKLAFLGASIQQAAMGAVFRYVNNTQFYLLIYNATGQKGYWDLLEFDPSHKSTNGYVSMLTAPVKGDTIGVAPNIGESWWIRCHLYQNQIVLSGAKASANNATNTFTKIVQYTTNNPGSNNLASGKHIQTHAGYVGAAVQSQSVFTRSVSNPTGANPKPGILNNRWFAQRFTVPPSFTSDKVNLVSYAITAKAKSIPGGTVSLYIIDDDGTGARPMAIGSQAAGLVASNAVYPVSEFGTAGNQGQITVTIGTQNGVPLRHSTNYWIVAVTTGVDTTSGSVFWLSNYATQDAANCISDDGTTWNVNGQGKRLCYTCTFAGQGSGVAVQGYGLYSQDEPTSLDYLMKEIAAKAGVFSTNAGAVLNETGASLTNFDAAQARGGWAATGGQIVGYNAASTYGYIRSTAATFHEAVIEFDMTIGAASTIKCGVLLNQQTAGDMTLDATLKTFLIEFSAAANTTTIYALIGAAPSAANIIFSSIGVVDIQTGKAYRVKVQHSGRFLMVFLNGVLTAAVKTSSTALVTDSINPAGYFGLMSYSNDGANDSAHPAVKFDNINIYELKETKDYFVIQANQTGMQAVQNLVKYDRLKYYGDYDGSWRYGYFDNVTLADATVYTNIFKPVRVSADTDWASRLRPFGDYFADRTSAALTDSEGTRFKSYDYTDARSDRGAFHAAAYPLRLSREMLDTLDFTAPANPGIQREDALAIQIDSLGIAAPTVGQPNYIVDGVTLRYVAGSPSTQPIFDMDVTARGFIAASGEAGV